MMLRRAWVAVLVVMALVAGMGLVPAGAGARAQAGTAVSKPLPPGRVSAGLSKSFRPPPRPDQAKGSPNDARHRALARIRAAIAARNAKPHRVPPVLPPALRAAANRIAQARAQHLITTTRQVGRPSRKGPRLSALPHEPAGPLPAGFPPAASVRGPMKAVRAVGVPVAGPVMPPGMRTAAPLVKTYGATYVPSGSWDVPPSYYSPGYMWVRVTNTGNFTWTANNFALGYHLFYSNGNVYNDNGLSTTLSSSVPPGYYLDVYASLQELPAGSFKVVWDMRDLTVLNGSGFFTSFGVPASQAVAFTVPHYPPSATIYGPPDGATENTLTPQLVIDVGSDGTQAVQAEFEICEGLTCYDSGWLSVPWTQGSFGATSVWSPPAGDLYWDTTYLWQVRVRDSSATTPWGPAQNPSLTTVVVDPPGSNLGVDPSGLDPAGVNMYLGNYARQEKDLSLPAAGMPLAIDRTYNSASARVAGAFGEGWSSLLDMHEVLNADASVTVTFPDGRQVTYGRNPDGTFAPASGESGAAQLTSLNELVMGGLTYLFGSCACSGPRSGQYVLQAIGGPAGYLSFTYDSYGDVTQIGSAVHDTAGNSIAGRSIYVTWANAGSASATVTSVSAAPPGTAGAPKWTYSYTADGSTGQYLTSVCDANAAPGCTSYGYGSSHQLTSVTRPDGASTNITVGYDSSGYVQSVAYPGGAWNYTRLTPNDGSGASLHVSVVDPRGNQVNYEYNQGGQLFKRWLGFTATAATTRTWAYDALGELEAMIDENGNSVQYGWSTRGYLNVTGMYRGNTLLNTAYTYYDDVNATAPGDLRNGQPVTVTDANNHAITYTYNTSGQVTSKTLPPTAAASSGAKTTYSYTCDNGTAPAVVNDPQQPTAVAGCGLLASVTDPDGRVTRYGYNHYGDQTQVTAPSGQVTNEFYDAYGRVTKKVVVTPQNPGGTETDYTYDGDGQVLTETDAAITNPVTGVTHQRKVTSTYDGDGNLVTSVASDLTGGDAARTTTHTYDGQDRQTSTAINGVTTSQVIFDAMGNLVKSTDGNGSVYQFDYNSYGQLAQIQLLNFTDDPGAGSTTPRNVILDTYYYDGGGRLAAYTNAMGQSVEYTYTYDNLKTAETYLGTDPATGNLRQITLHSYTYDNAGNLTSDATGADATGAGARTTAMTYDAANQPLTQTVDPGGLNRTTSYSYDPAGLVTATNLSDGTRTESTTNLYNAAGQLWETSVHNDATPDLVTAYSRDAQGHVLTSTDPRGVAAAGSASPPDPAYTTTSTYDVLGRLSTTTGPAVQAEDGTGTAPATTSPVTTNGYDTFGEVTDARDARGLVTHTIYDALGRKTEVDYPAYKTPGGTTITPKESWTYDNNGNVLSHTDKAGQTTRYAYDMRNRAYQITLPPAASGATPGVIQRVYDDNGNLLSQIDPTGAQTLYTYDDMDRMVALDRVVRNGTPVPAEYVTSYGYDNFSEITSIQTAHTIQTRGYDAAGELVSDSSTGRGTTTYAYDVAGRVTKVTDPLGRHVDTSYDLAGRRTKTTDYNAAGTALATTSYTTDPAGNATAVTDPNGSTWKAAYDAANHLTSLTDPVPATAGGTALPAPVTTIGYDAAGHQTRVTDANGNPTYQTYNSLGLPETLTEPATTAQPAAADRTWTTSYDAAGNATSVAEPGGVTITDSYNNLGNLTAQTGTGGDANASRTFGYDANGRLTSAATPAGTQTFTYDDRGLLTASSGPQGSASYSYDAEGRVATQNDASGSLSYTYSGLTDVGSVTDTLSGLTRTYTHDTAGQTTAQTDTTVSGAAAKRTFGYDGMGRLTSDVTTSPSGTVTASQAYGYDPNGNLTSQTTGGQLASAHTQTYSYDTNNRLIRAANTTASTGADYGYDGTGNRTSMTTWTGTAASHTTTATTTASYDQRNRIQQVSAPAGTTGYTWSPRGTLASTTTTPAGGTATTTQQKFDAFNQLIGNGGQAYSYDALGRLSAAATGGITTNTFSYAGLGQEPVSDGQYLIARAFDGTPLAAKGTSSGASPVSLLQNAHGDVVAATGPATGTVQASRAYDPFGNITAATGTAGVLPPVGYQGSWTDPATGLASAQARWYDPATGAFTSQDSASVPLASATDANGYLYAGANPATYNDPTGQNWWNNWWHDIAVGLQATVTKPILRLSEAAIQVATGIGEGAAATAEAAIPVAEVAGESLVAVAGAPELVAGALVLVAVAGTGALIWAIAHANGSLTYQAPARCGMDPNTGQVTACALPQQQQVTGSPSTSATAAQNPPRPQPVHVTATWTTSSTRSWSTVTKWWDDTYLYVRTDHWTYTTTFQHTNYSNGAWAVSGPFTSWTHTWDTARTLLIDLSHPIKAPTPKAGPAQIPTLGNGTASASGTCGQGGSAAACASNSPNTGLPPGALQQQNQAQDQGAAPQTQTGASGGAGGNGGGGPPAPSGACSPGPGGSGNSEFNGVARVHLHPPANADEFGHASIEVTQCGGDTMHTHQVGTIGTKAFSRTWTGGPGADGIYEFPLPNAGGALAQQEVFQAQGLLGMYDIETRSCMTYCAAVLRAGGVQGVPQTTSGFLSWILNTDF